MSWKLKPSTAAFVAALALNSLVTTALAATVSVHCPSESINAAIQDAFAGQGHSPVTDQLTINLRGRCRENVEAPPLRKILIIGGEGASLQPNLPNTPALRVRGNLTVRKLTVQSSLQTGGALIEVGPMAFFALEESDVISSTAQFLLKEVENSQVEIGNSTLTGGIGAAVFVFDTSHLTIYANHGNTVIRRPGADRAEAIGCYQAGLLINANHPPATVTIGPSPVGIAARSCTSLIAADEGTIVKITGATQRGIELKSGDSFNLVRTTITGNPGRAIEVNAGVMEIDNSTISGNGSGIAARIGTTIRFNRIYGPSQVADGPNRYTCYQGGHIYSEPGYISGNPDSTSCLQVSGPETH